VDHFLQHLSYKELKGFIPTDHRNDTYVWSVLEVENFRAVLEDPSKVEIDCDIFVDRYSSLYRKSNIALEFHLLKAKPGEVK
jgi:hypothetical protein